MRHHLCAAAAPLTVSADTVLITHIKAMRKTYRQQIAEEVSALEDDRQTGARFVLVEQGMRLGAFILFDSTRRHG